MARSGDRRWVVILVVVLLVGIGALVGMAGLRLAQLRSVPMAAPRALPATGSGSTALEVSGDAWADASGPAVQSVLGRYFAAINSKDYAAWVATVTPARASSLSEQAWRTGFSSTTDGTLRLSRIDTVAPGRLVAMVSYLSTQRPEDAPSGLRVGRICWREAIPLVGDPPLVDAVRPGAVLRGPC